MIGIHDVARRRSRKDDQNETDFHSHSYTYVLKLPREGLVENIQICFKAFIAIFGVSETRLKTIKKALSITGK